MNISYKDKQHIQNELASIYGRQEHGTYTYKDEKGRYVLGYDIPWLCRFYGVEHRYLLMTINNLREQNRIAKYIKENR